MGNLDSHEIDLSDRNLSCLPVDLHTRSERAITKFYARRNRIQALPSSITESFAKLTEISLRDNLITQFPLELCQLPNLIKVSLSFNRIREIPADISKMESLQLLSLAGNLIENLPEEICDLVQLHGLDLQRNQLKVLPSAIGQLTQLSALLLQKNRLSIVPDSIRQCVRLRCLNLSNNILTELPLALLDLTGLEELLLSCNQLKALPKGFFARLIHLQNFDAHSNSISSIPDDIWNCVYLRRLNLALNEISSLPERIGALSQLEWLNLNANQLETLPSSIGQLKILRKIGLVQNKLKRLPNEVVLMRGLVKLDLRKNALQAFPPTIRFMQSLTSLLMDENPLFQQPGLLLDTAHACRLPSCRELAARALWRSSPQCRNGRRPSMPELDKLPYLLQDYAAAPWMCHQCLGPYCHEKWDYIDLSPIRSMDATVRVPVLFHFCSSNCIKLYERGEIISLQEPMAQDSDGGEVEADVIVPSKLLAALQGRWLAHRLRHGKYDFPLFISFGNVYCVL